MARTRFPGVDVVPSMFSAQYPLCGGTQLLSRIDRHGGWAILNN